MDDGPCCRDVPPSHPDLDTPLSLAVLPGLFRALSLEPLRLEIVWPEGCGWQRQVLDRAEEALTLFEDPPDTAWIVQRPGCGGLITRLVFLDRRGDPLAFVAPRRSPGAPEPVAWRVHLLVSIVGSRPASDDR